MRRAAVLIVASGLVFVSSRPAAAGEFGVSLEGGYFNMSNAHNSAQAVFGNSAGGFTGGGSIRYVLGRSFFFGAGTHYFERTGQRVFVADASSTPFRLGHPLTIRTVPVYAMAGWRFSPDSRLVPYVALGAGATAIRETSTVGGLAEPTLSQSKFSGHFLAGLEWGRSVLPVGAEVMYTTVPNSIGVGGVSKIYGETDLGGFTAVGKIVVVAGGR